MAVESHKLLDLLDTKFGDQYDVQVGEWDAANMIADVLLVDGSSTNEIMEVATRSQTRLILSTARKQSRGGEGPSMSGWTRVVHERISHRFLEGHSTDCRFYSTPTS
jgi:hypothetical protein